MRPLGENMSNIPAFLGKLWRIVNDPNLDHLICWSSDGNSFIIQNQAQFWYELLPLYYKHNNMSSFVRQLNMYGFHKMTSVENGTMDADKDEFQFFHKYFHRDQPGLLRNIKRKATVSKPENVQNALKYDDLSKVLFDVKQLYGKQSRVDTQLSAMKQENAVLWRELAILRQKHLKQQQIVNKLIQFLLTLVQPSASSRMGVGVKRRIPLMLNENPVSNKKAQTVENKITNNLEDGPTIHELDNEIEILHENSLESNIARNNEEIKISDLVPEIIMSENETSTEETNTNLSQSINQIEKEIFLNPNSGNTLLSTIANGNYNLKAITSKNGNKNHDKTIGNSNNKTLDLNGSDIQVANRVNHGNSLDVHLDTTQNEIDQLKDILKGCNTLDANTLLGLFNDEAPSYGLTFNPNEGNKYDIVDGPTADPMVSGTELVTCGSNLISFEELFDDSLNNHDTSDTIPATEPDNMSINTPLILKSEPIFPIMEEDL